jgi:hypothetical protein
MRYPKPYSPDPGVPCGNCGKASTYMPYETFKMGDPDSRKVHPAWYCTGCHLSKDGDRWVSPYNELKRIDDRYRAEQN